MPDYKHLTPPTTGQIIGVKDDGHLDVPNNPVIPFIEGDGIGPDIWAASVRVFDEAVAKAYKGDRKIEWFEVFAGEKAHNKFGEWLPEDTTKAIEHYKVAIKGPLTTPVGGGIRSLNVSLRQIMDLYACVRPVRWFNGVPSPVKAPEKTNVVIFRENTEDVYSGVEYASGTPEAQKVFDFLTNEMGAKLQFTPGIGVKPISPEGTKRLVRKSIQYALDRNLPSVTLVHKGNIMKFTEGAFRDWGYELAKEEFRDQIITEDELWDDHNGQMPEGKLLIKDRIADAMFQQILLRPDEYSVMALPNLNGDYMSDAAVAIVGGLGLGPGANIGDEVALFEATHGTAPKYAGQDKVNPGSVILSGVMMFEHLGWQEVADSIVDGIQGAINARTVTYDLARQMPDATKVKCSEFGDAIIKHLG